MLQPCGGVSLLVTGVLGRCEVQVRLGAATGVLAGVGLLTTTS